VRGVRLRTRYFGHHAIAAPARIDIYVDAASPRALSGRVAQWRGGGGLAPPLSLRSLHPRAPSVRARPGRAAAAAAAGPQLKAATPAPLIVRRTFARRAGAPSSFRRGRGPAHRGARGRCRCSQKCSAVAGSLGRTRAPRRAGQDKPLVVSARHHWPPVRRVIDAPPCIFPH
jgi:hypothetical protein